MLLVAAPQAAETPPEIVGGANTELVILALLGVGGIFTIGLLILLAVLLRHIPPGQKPAEPEAAAPARPGAPLEAGTEAPDGATVIRLDD